MKKLIILFFSILSFSAFSQVKISDMPAATVLNGTEIVPIVQGGVNKKATISLWPQGSVTSVGLSAPSFLSVSGSPVTGSGTLSLSYSGTALPVANGGTGLTSLGTSIQYLRTNFAATGTEWAAPQVVYADDLGAVGDGVTINSDILQTIITNNVGKRIVIGQGTAQTYLIDKALNVPSNSIIEVNGIIKLANGTIRPLTADLSIGAFNTISVANADTYFKVGQRIVVSADNANINGGGAWKTRKVGNTNIITGVTSTTITCQFNFAVSAAPINSTGYTVANNARVSQANNVFIIRDADNIRISGTGILDGNKANQYNIAGADWNQSSEDVSSSCGISLNGTNIEIKDITIQNFVLHGISTSNIANIQAAGNASISKNVTIRNVNFFRSVDKAVAGLNCDNLDVDGCLNEYGVDEGEIIFYNNVTNGKIRNCTSRGNRRYGIALTGGNNGLNTVENCTFINGFNVPSSINLYIQNQAFGTNINNLVFDSEFAIGSWSRSGTTITVNTAFSHNLTAAQTIWVETANSSGAIPDGYYVITIVDADTFTFTGVNTGFTTGNLNYISHAPGANITFTASSHQSAKNIKVLNQKITTSGITSSTSSNIFIDGLSMVKGNNQASSRVFTVGTSAKATIQNFSIDGYNRIFNDVAGNSDILFQNGNIGAYTSLFETNSGTFRFKDISGVPEFENQSTVRIPAGQQSVLVTHGLSITPSFENIEVLPITLGTATQFRVGSINANGFAIYIDRVSSSDAIFKWKINTHTSTQSTEPVYTTSYVSDFSAGTDTWTTSNATLTGNQDGIVGGTITENDALAASANVGVATHTLQRAIATVSQSNRIRLKYYIPAGNTVTNGFRIYINGGVLSLAAIYQTGGAILGQWVEVVTEAFTPTSTSVTIYLTNGFNNSYNGTGEVIYFKDIVCERVTGTAATTNGVNNYQPTFANVLVDPMTTRGDVIVRNASNATARLGIGGAGTFLSSDGTDVSWATPSGSGSYYAPNTLVANATDADFTATANGVHNILDGVASTNRVITIPTGANGDVMKFYNTEDTRVWSFTGATVYLADRVTVVTELLFNVPCHMERIDGLWIITN